MELEAFRIEERSQDGRHTLILEGELDMASAPALEGMFEQLLEAGARELVVDLSRLEFMDSTGLNAILRCQALCDEHLCDLGLIPGASRVQRVFELTRLTDRLPFRWAGEAQRAAPR